MKPLWVVQTNLGLQSDVDALIEAAFKLTGTVRTKKVVPFLNKLPEIPTNGPVIFYGSAGWTTAIAASKRWRPGVWYDPSTMCVSHYRACLGDWYINHDAQIMPLREVPNYVLNHDYKNYIFIRPDADDKSFAGEVMSYNDITIWIENLLSIGYTTPNVDTLVAIAPNKAIIQEWRCFIAEGKYIAGSRYRVNGRLSVEHHVPIEVQRFAEAAYAKCGGLPAMVAIDIGLEDEIDEPCYRVIEAGCMNACGFYASDIPIIVEHATRIAEAQWVLTS